MKPVKDDTHKQNSWIQNNLNKPNCKPRWFVYLYCLREIIKYESNNDSLL